MGGGGETWEMRRRLVVSLGERDGEDVGEAGRFREASVEESGRDMMYLLKCKWGRGPRREKTHEGGFSSGDSSLGKEINSHTR